MQQNMHIQEFVLTHRRIPNQKHTDFWPPLLDHNLRGRLVRLLLKVFHNPWITHWSNWGYSIHSCFFWGDWVSTYNHPLANSSNSLQWIVIKASNHHIEQNQWVMTLTSRTCRHQDMWLRYQLKTSQTSWGRETSASSSTIGWLDSRNATPSKIVMLREEPFMYGRYIKPLNNGHEAAKWFHGYLIYHTIIHGQYIPPTIFTWWWLVKLQFFMVTPWSLR